MSESLYATTAERSLLGLLIADVTGSALQDCEGLQPEHFASEFNRSAFKAVQTLTKRALPHDAKSVAAAMDPVDGVDAVDELQAAASHVRHFKTTAKAAVAAIKEGHTRRGVAELAYRLTEMAQDSGQSIQDIAAAVSSASQLLAKQQTKKAAVSLYEALLMRTEYHDGVAAGLIQAARPTRMSWLDQQLNGGLRGGKLVYIGARPGVGKSAFSLQILNRQGESGYPGLFLSQEMSVEELGDRATASELDVSYSNISSGQISTDEWNRISTRMTDFQGVPVHFVDQGGMTINDIRAHARAIPGLKNLVVDYIQLCTATSARQNRNAEIEEISRGLKSLAMELDITVIALSQLSRKVEERADHEPQLSDLRDSGSIEQDADVVIFLWPVRELSPGVQLVGCKVEKNRVGRRGGKTGLMFDGDRQRFTQSTESIAPPAPAPAVHKPRGFHQ